MAKEPEEKEKILTLDERTTNTLFDKNGNKLLSTEFIKQEYETNNGDTEYKTLNAEHLEGSDGTFFSAAQISTPEARGGITLRRCDGCEDETKTFIFWLLHRNERKLTLSPAKNIRQCFSCRRNFCEKHYVLTIHDKHIRCKDCDRRFQRNRLLKAFLKTIFLKRINHE